MVSIDSKLIFLTPPKTASNSLRNSLALSNIKFNDFDPNYHKPNTHLYLSELVENFKIKNIENYKIIQIYRDPFEKFRSAFYHFISLIPNHFKVVKLSLNDFVLHYKECITSDNYVKCMYDDPNFVYSLIENKINFGCTRYFVEQYKWNDLSQDVKYLDISNINYISEFLGYEIPKINHLNVFYGKKEEFNNESVQIISDLYKKDFYLIN